MCRMYIFNAGTLALRLNRSGSKRVRCDVKFCNYLLEYREKGDWDNE